VRVKGKIGIRRDIKETMEGLRLTRANHCIIVNKESSTEGMLSKVKDYVTWGEISQETLVKLLKAKGKLSGDRPLTDQWIKENLEYEDIEHFARALIEEKVKYSNVSSIKPVIRLHPPIKGWGHTKRSFKEGGALGYRGEKINELIERMIQQES
jgi:large subunit ribosomal protein L30